MSFIQRIWKDPVWANVIASLIGLALTAAGAALAGLSWNRPISISLWIIVAWGVLSAVAVLYIVRDAKGRNTARDLPPQAVPRTKQNKIAIERLSNQLKIRYDFVAPPGTPKRTGQAVWDETYLEVLRILGPKLMAGAEEASLQRYLDKALKDDSAGKLDVVHVLVADFQSMKVRLEDMGVIILTPGDLGKMYWGLASAAREILPKLKFRVGK